MIMANLKKISFLTIIFILIIFVFYTLTFKSGSIKSSLKNFIPEKVKVLLKSPQYIEDQEKRLRKLKADIVLLNAKYDYINGNKIEKKITSKLGENYKIIIQPIPFPEYNAFEGKPVGYIDIINDNLILASGTG